MRCAPHGYDAMNARLAPLEFNFRGTGESTYFVGVRVA